MSTEEKPDRRRGPRTTQKSAPDEAALRKQIEEETRARLEDELREKIERETREKFEAERVASGGTESVASQIAPDRLDVDVDLEADGVTVNFVEDGFTVLGKVWYTGEVITVKRDSPEWDLLTDRNGKMLLTLDEDEQVEKWGRRMFRPGTGNWKSFDLDDPDLSPEDRERLRAIQEKRQARVSQPGKQAAGKALH